MVGFSVADVAERLDAVRARIAAAGGQGVRVVAVTKTFGVDAILAATAAGCDGIGENYAQELVAKWSSLPPDAAVPPVHFIGQLQTNKVRLVVPCVDVYESVDRASLADELARRAPGAAVLVQVRPPGDGGAGKAGCDADEVPALIDRCRERGLDVRGLMTVGPTEGGAEAARPGFRAVRAMVDRWGLSVCSMGMTDDLEVAVGEGSTQVRVGSALFGPRPPR